jgi:uncharacterized membrane protein
MSGLHHDHAPWMSSSKLSRWLWWAIGAWALATAVAVIALWPTGRHEAQDESGGAERVEATVQGVAVQPCSGTDESQGIACRLITFDLTSGSARGTSAVVELGVSDSSAKVPDVGDDVLLDVQTDGNGGVFYSFVDYRRGGSMLVLVMIFVAAVLLLGRWRGLGALAGLAISLVALIWFVLPALLDGSNPVLVAVVGSSVIAYVSLYLAHGFGPATNVALLSTLLCLALTGLLAWLFVHAATLTGLSDESSLFLESLGVRIDPRGLLLAGVVIGSLGVLDDVTVTQVSAVGELHRLQPAATVSELYRAAVTIGRDHISSTVNTLVLAYAGAALPLLVLFTEVGNSISDVATREQVAVEIVRTLVGSIGLVASVPISTALAAAVLSREGDGGAAYAAEG